MSGNAFVLAGALGMLGRFTESAVRVIGESDLDSAMRAKLNAEWREAERQHEEECRRERANARPHASTREAQRRRRQIERGQLKAENGLAR